MVHSSCKRPVTKHNTRAQLHIDAEGIRRLAKDHCGHRPKSWEHRYWCVGGSLSMSGDYPVCPKPSKRVITCGEVKKRETYF